MLIRSYSLLTKIEIRKNLCSIRRAIPLEERSFCAQSAAKILIDQPLFKNSIDIACYLSNADELDSKPLIEEIWRARKHCYLPVLAQGAEKFLDFARFRPHDQLHLNRYRILEPENKETIAPEKLDLVLIPLVGFDSQGNRLGMGGGYYDRTFNFIIQKSPTNPILIGYGYEKQLIEQLPHDPWDVPLNGVLTEKKLRFFDS